MEDVHVMKERLVKLQVEHDAVELELQKSGSGVIHLGAEVADYLRRKRVKLAGDIDDLNTRVAFCGKPTEWQVPYLYERIARLERKVEGG